MKEIFQETQNNKVQTRQKSNWLKGETIRQLFFAFPNDIVRAQLESAFNTTSKESKGLLHASKKYEFHITANKVYLKLTSDGRHRLSFRMKGELFDDPRGTRMEMAVQNTPSGLLALAVSSLLILSYGGFLLAPLFAILGYSVMALNRSFAADSISSRLNEIISKARLDG